MLLVQGAQGVQRIAGAPQRSLDATYGHPVVFEHGELAHAHSMFEGCECLVERVLVDGHDQHAVHFRRAKEMPHRLLMSQMWRIEAPSKDRYAHGLKSSPRHAEPHATARR